MSGQPRRTQRKAHLDASAVPEGLLDELVAIAGSTTIEKELPEMSAQLFAWGWKQQAPVEEIAAAVNEMSQRGRVYMREFDTQTGDFAWIVADSELSDEQAAAIWAETEQALHLEDPQ